MTFGQKLRTRTLEFAIRTVRFSRALPADRATGRIVHQLIGASTSVAANYRAACRARSRAEFIAKLGLVVEEADETAFWLELIERIPLASNEELTYLRGEAAELLAILAAAHLTAKANRSRGTIAPLPSTRT